MAEAPQEHIALEDDFFEEFETQGGRRSQPQLACPKGVNARDS
jgi:hypothetical protein